MSRSIKRIWHVQYCTCQPYFSSTHMILLLSDYGQSLIPSLSIKIMRERCKLEVVCQKQRQMRQFSEYLLLDKTHFFTINHTIMINLFFWKFLSCYRGVYGNILSSYYRSHLMQKWSAQPKLIEIVCIYFLECVSWTCDTCVWLQSS